LLAQNVQSGANILRFSADGLRLAAGGSQSAMFVWEVPSGTLLHQLGGSTTGWAMPTFLGSTWVTARIGLETKIWDLDSPKHWCRPIGSGGKCAFDVRFDREGQQLVVAYADHCVGLWDLETKTCRRFEAGSQEATSADLSPNGDLLASVGYDGFVRVMGAADGREVFNVQAASTQVLSCVRFLGDGSTLVWGAKDRIGVLTLREQSVRYIEAHSGRIPQLAPSRNGKVIVSSSAPERSFRNTAPLPDGSYAIAAHGLSDGREMWRYAAPAPARALAYSPDDKTVAFSCDDLVIRVLDAVDGELVRELKGVGTTCFGLVFHPLGRLLFSVHRNGEVVLWDVQTGENIARFKAADCFASAVAISPDGNTLATASEDGVVRTWDLTYFRPHVAANLRYWRERLSRTDGALQAGAWN
jgi:WD40 repeat protein